MNDSKMETLMEKFLKQEEDRLSAICKLVDAHNNAYQQAIREFDEKLEALEKARLEESSWKGKHKIEDKLRELKDFDPKKRQKAFRHPDSPYFARFDIDDDDLGKRTHLLGKQTLFDGPRVAVLDWREAALSRLYYEYEEGEDYEETVNGRERSGILTKKVKYSISERRLEKIETSDGVYTRSGEEWSLNGAPIGSAERKEVLSDFSMVDIVAFIDPKQFRILTQKDKCICLTGSAGSGKTTVALHRLAYFLYKEGLDPSDCLVLMLNRPLKEYSKKLVDDICGTGVNVETFFSFAAKEFKGLSFERGPTAIAAEKRSRKIQEAVLKEAGSGRSLDELYLELGSESLQKWVSEKHNPMFIDLPYLYLLKPRVRKYSHIVIDEAQDFGKPELACIFKALKDGCAMTVCADEDQRIYAFSDPEGLDFLKSSLAQVGLSSRQLEVAYRCPEDVYEKAKALQNGDILEEESLEEALSKVDKEKELTCIVCANSQKAQEVAERLGISSELSFEPGVVVSDVFHIKGLEFSNIIIYRQEEFGQDKYGRSRLYVAATRAMKKLFLAS